MEETRLSIGVEEAYDRGRRPACAVLMGQTYGSVPRPGLHKDRLREKLTFNEALEFLRGLRLGFALGSGSTRPGPKALKFLNQEAADESHGKEPGAADSYHKG